MNVKSGLAERGFKVLSVILLVGLIVVSGLYVDLSRKFKERGERLEAVRGWRR